MIIRDEARLKALEATLPHYAETRPHQVKKMGFEPQGLWAVGPTSERRVRWLFEKAIDLDGFFKRHRHFVLIKGTLCPLVTETRIFK